MRLAVLRRIICIFLVVTGVVTFLLVWVTQQSSHTQVAQEIPLPLASVAPIPVWSAATPQPETATQFLASVSAQAVYVLDVPSAATLLEKNSKTTLYPASTTKMMTALVASEVYQPGQVLTVSQEGYTQGNVMGLQVGENITVQSLLEGLLITSANDAALVLADNYPSGYDGFIAKMNTKAAELQLKQTTYANPSGVDLSTQQTTARDLAIVAREVMKQPALRELVRTPEKLITSVDQKYRHQVKTTNELLTKLSGQVVGVKTGTTLLAGQVLVTQIERDGRSIMIVVMNSQDRYTDTEKIVEYIFAQYRWEDV